MAKRAIFEEQTGAATRTTAQTGAIERGKGARGAIRAWLVALFGMVVAIIVVGGLTRLTGSGLSITEWRPLSGAIPPLTAEDWAREFENYRRIDQYQLVNQGMSLGEFQFIFWWEWAHRQLGRIMGLVWAVGFLWFWLRKDIPTGWTPKLLVLGFLGGLQGAIGWWMVSSGITEGEGMVRVASYRLATHLGLAFLILGVIAWYILELSRSEAQLLAARRGQDRKLFGISTGLTHLIFVQIVLGALVAGIDAGRGYTDWPLMAGGFLPPFPFELEPAWRNFFENDGLVQFIHRMVAYLLVIYALAAWFAARKNPHLAVREAFWWAFAALFAQVALGIVTLVHGAPWQLGIAHQLMAVVLFVVALRARFMARYPSGATIARG